MKNGITLVALFVMVASLGSVGIMAALPEDIVNMDTPADKKVYWQGKITERWDMLIRVGFEGPQLEQLLFRYYDYAMEELEQHKRMYEYLSVTEYTTDVYPVIAGNGSF